MTNRLLVPNGEHVVAEVVEGEAVIINVATGIYYSSQGTGGWVWERLAGGCSFDGIVTDTVRCYAVAEDKARADLQSFVSDLLRENLVLEKPCMEDTPAPARSSADGPIPYAPPQLDIFRDMKDLLALDPPMPRLDLAAR